MKKPERRFDPEPLTIAPALFGRRLPSPRRRLAALGIDVVLLLVPALAAAALFSAVALRVSDPVGYRALKQAILDKPDAPAEQHAMLRGLAPLLARIDATGLPAAVKADVEAGDLDRAADRLNDAAFLVTLTLTGNTQPVPKGTIVLEVERFVPKSVRSAAMFLVPALYFAVTTAWWGRTLGKRLLGLQVVRLDGRSLTLLEGLERFGSYFAVAGTLGLGVLDLWRNPNRRLAHDLAVETVVVRA